MALLIINLEWQQKKMLMTTDKEAQIINTQNVLTCNISHHHVHHHNPLETL